MLKSPVVQNFARGGLLASLRGKRYPRCQAGSWFLHGVKRRAALYGGGAIMQQGLSRHGFYQISNCEAVATTFARLNEPSDLVHFTPPEGAPFLSANTGFDIHLAIALRHQALKAVAIKRMATRTGSPACGENCAPSTPALLPSHRPQSINKFMKSCVGILPPQRKCQAPFERRMAKLTLEEKSTPGTLRISGMIPQRVSQPRGNHPVIFAVQPSHIRKNRIIGRKPQCPFRHQESDPRSHIFRIVPKDHHINVKWLRKIFGFAETLEL